MTHLRHVRTLAPVLVLGLAACATPTDEPREPDAVPPVVVATPAPVPAPIVRSQTPEAVGPTAMVAAVSLQDQMSAEEINALLAAHGVELGGLAGGGSLAFAVPESQVAFATELLRREGPKQGNWVLTQLEHGVDAQPATVPPEIEWPLLASDLPFDEALERFPATTPAGALLRHPVLAAWARATPQVKSLSAYARNYRDADLASHEGLVGKIELGDGTRSVGSFLGLFQAWEDGTRVELLWWPMRAVSDTGPAADADLVPIVGTNVMSPTPVEWMLGALADAGIVVFPLPGTPRPADQAYTLFGVASSDADRARALLRSAMPEWARLDVIED